MVDQSISHIIDNCMQKDLKDHKYSYNENDILGEGSFGRVFKGYNNHTQKLVALKQIQLAKLQKGQQMLKQILLSEISVMRKFNRNMEQDPCPFLVRQEDVFRTDKHIFIVMQICLGGTLEDEMRAKRFKQKQCIQILYCISKGLEYMGDMGITHRDLKPENIFISSTKMAQGKDRIIYKIGDFGFAAQKQQFDIAMGTMPYMAPEMFKKEKYTNRVDVWSLGIIAYQICFGGLYFIGKDRFEIKKNIIEKPFVLSDRQKAKVSANYQDFLNRCLNKQAKYRMSTDQLLNHPLFHEIHKELASIEANINSNQQLQPTKPSAAETKGEEQRIFEEVPVNDQKPEQGEQTQAEKTGDLHLVAFSKVFHLLEECSKMRVLAESFHILQEKTKRQTQFIQLYLLKDAYAMMNRLTYTVMQKQNHVQLEQPEFQALLSPQYESLYKELYGRCVQQCTWVTGLFNQKYKWFMNSYLPKFSPEDQPLIKKVVTEEPYEYANPQVFEKELRKWQYVIAEDQESGQNRYAEWKQLGSECKRILQMKLKG